MIWITLRRTGHVFDLQKYIWVRQFHRNLSRTCDTVNNWTRTYSRFICLSI